MQQVYTCPPVSQVMIELLKCGFLVTMLSSHENSVIFIINTTSIEGAKIILSLSLKKLKNRALTWL